MALPVTITGISTAISPIGPFRSNGGNYYFFGRDGTTATTLQAFKATAPDTSWASITTKTGFATSIVGLYAYQVVGDIIHIIITDGTASTSVNFKYQTFNMATDTFDTAETIASAVATGANGGGQPNASLVVRSTGEVVAFFNSATVSGFATVSYSRRTGVNTWSAPTRVDATTVDAKFPIVVLGASDSVHFIWSQTNTLQRTLSAANVLQTQTSNASGAVSLIEGISYVAGATTKVLVASGGNFLFYFDSGNTPTINAFNPGLVDNRLLVDENDSDKVWLIGRNSTDSDLYTIFSTTHGASWSTAVSAFVGTVIAGGLSSCPWNPYPRGSNFVIPYIVNDNATLKYNEYIIRGVAIPKTFYVLGTAAASPSWNGNLQEGGTAPADAACTFGYAPGKLAVASYCKSRLGASAAATVTGTTSYVSGVAITVGTGATITTAGDTFSPTTTYNGTFASGNWTFVWNMRAGTAGCVGRLGMRVWASVNANGSSARELTSGEIFGTTVTLSTSVNTNSGITWAAPAITLTNEYLFFQLEYQEQTSAGSSNSDNALFRVGSSITTTVFTNKYTLVANQGSYAVAGKPNNMDFGHRLQAAKGSYSIAGNDTGVPIVTPWTPFDTDLTGNMLTEDSVAGVQHYTQRVVNFIAGDSYQYSIEYLPFGPNPRGLFIQASAAGAGLSVTGSNTGVELASANSANWAMSQHSVTSVGGGFYKILVKGTRTQSTANGNFGVYLYSTSTTYNGDGNSGVQFQNYSQLHFSVFNAAQGSYGVAGNPVTLCASRILIAASGSYAVAGRAATLRATHIPLMAAQGSYNITGNAATFKKTSPAATPPAYASQGTFLAYGGGRGSSVLPAPSGITNGDLLIAYLFMGRANIAIIDPTPPTGWSMLPGSPTSVTDGGGFNGKYYIFYKLASSESGDYTFTFDIAAYSSCGIIIRYTGVDPTTPFNIAATTNIGASTDATALGLTTTVNNTLIIFTEHDWGDNTNNCVPPTGTTPTFTERLDDVLIYIADGPMTTAGATGNETHFTNSVGANPWGAYLIALNPVAVVSGTVLTADKGSYSVSGNAATLRYSRIFAAAKGAYAVAGNAAFLRYGRIALAATSGAYAVAGKATTIRATHNSLVAAQGSYALSGKADTFLWTHKLVAAQGSYALSGKADTFLWTHTLVAAQGAYAISGKADTFLWTHTLVAAQGAYATTGIVTTLRYTSSTNAAVSIPYGITGFPAKLIATHKPLIAAQGAYSVIGRPAVRGYSTLLAQGAYAYAGKAAFLRYGRIALAAASGTYAVSGRPATLAEGHRLIASQGAYSVTGRPATLSHAYTLLLAKGSYAIIGWTAVRAYGLSLAQGAYAVSGKIVTTKVQRSLASAKGSYAVLGNLVDIRKVGSYSFDIQRGSYGIIGNAVTFIRTIKFLSNRGSYTSTGNAAGLKRGLKLNTAIGSYDLAGQAVTLQKNYKFSAAKGAYASIGNASTKIHEHNLIAFSRAYAVTGQLAGSKRRYQSAVASGVYSISDNDADLINVKHGSLTADRGRIALSGNPVTFLLTNTRSDSYGVAGSPVTFIRSFRKYGAEIEREHDTKPTLIPQSTVHVDKPEQEQATSVTMIKSEKVTVGNVESPLSVSAKKAFD